MRVSPLLVGYINARLLIVFVDLQLAFLKLDSEVVD